MGKTVTALFIASALAFGYAGTARGADFCLDIATGFDTLALKSFSVPGLGACKETRGFYLLEELWVIGMACGSSDGTHITFAHTAVGGTVARTERFTVDRAMLSGSGSLCLVDTGVGGGCFLGVPIARIPCSPKTVAVP